jgi:trimethylamine--corrinoid protein Co-methyltransferase
LTDAHVPDFQAGVESSLAMAAALRSGAHFVLHASGVLSAFNVLSFQKLVLDDEVCGALKAAHEPIPVAEEQVALEVVRAVGPGGNFLLEEHTLLHCRDYERPSLFNRANRDAWTRRGAADAAESARERVEEVLGSYRPPELDGVVRRQLEAYCGAG